MRATSELWRGGLVGSTRARRVIRKDHSDKVTHATHPPSKGKSLLGLQLTQMLLQSPLKGHSSPGGEMQRVLFCPFPCNARWQNHRDYHADGLVSDTGTFPSWALFPCSETCCWTSFLLWAQLLWGGGARSCSPFILALIKEVSSSTVSWKGAEILYNRRIRAAPIHIPFVPAAFRVKSSGLHQVNLHQTKTIAKR